VSSESSVINVSRVSSVSKERSVSSE